MDGLCVGGVLDGKTHSSNYRLVVAPRMKLEPTQSFYHSGLDMKVVLDKPTDLATLEYDHYEHRRWRGEKEDFHFWALKGLSNDDIMRRLIEAYKKERCA